MELLMGIMMFMMIYSMIEKFLGTDDKGLAALEIFMGIGLIVMFMSFYATALKTATSIRMVNGSLKSEIDLKDYIPVFITMGMNLLLLLMRKKYIQYHDKKKKRLKHS